MSLTTCLKKATALSPENRAAIFAAARALRKSGVEESAASKQAVDDLIAQVEVAIAKEEAAPTVQTATPPAAMPVVQDAPQAQNTEPQEKSDDPATTSDAPALDQPVVERPVSEAVTRGTQQPRRTARRADGGDVRGQGGLFEGVDDEGGNLGNSEGAGTVPNAAPDAVAGSDGRVSANDFRPGIGGLTREGSWFDTARRNLDLIDLARKIESEKRDATPDEQAQLAKYVGFGASEIRNAMFPVAQAWQKTSAPPGSLIFPDAVREARWKALAERAAALPIEWQRTMLQSTQYAHYTSEGIIRSVWSAVQRLGFTGGKVFEPGGGIGSFAMLMPDGVHKTSKFTGIEFDGPTALIARLLSPGQNMLHDDFIKRRLPDNFFDVSVGNPPFSPTPITADPRYAKQKFMLHDYFFAKAIDKVRPGGLLAFVTSKGTMDKQTDKARRYLMERADLIGAIRLPSTAFEDNAGTSVVTDVIFLRKRMPGEAPGGQPWANVKTVDTKDGPTVINEYFAANPDMVLGQNRISGNTDDMGRRINSNGRGSEKYTVVSYDTTPDELDAKFAAAVERLPANVYSALAQEPGALKAEVAKMDFDPKVKREGVVYVGKGGELFRVENGVGTPLASAVKLSAKDAAWLTDYVGVRDLVKEAQLAQVTDGAWEPALKKLNKAYDAFVKKNGPINAFRTQTRKSTDEDGNEVESTTRIFTNRRLFREDYDAALMTQLETIDEDGNVKKAAFLNGRTIGKPVTREVKSIGDALAVSLDAIGGLNLNDVADRLKISRQEAIEALGSQIYQVPGGDWQLADEYLSGNVVEKLAQAIDAARLDRTLERNVEALKAVQPEKLGPSQISVKLGAPWVDVSHINDFAKEIEAGTVTFDTTTESWEVTGGNLRSQRRAGAEYGTAARSPSELLEAILNSRSIKVMQTVDKKTVVDEASTTAANEMAKTIKDKFKSWVWTDSERAADLVESYNARYNNLAPRVFDGSHLTLPGVSLRYKLHPHQLRAIWRQIQTGSTYLAHAVGAGKTIEMIAGGMEQKRLGLIRKPMYVVPNHMLEQFSNEFMELYPLANIMVADDQNFSKERRKAFVAAATLNAPDAIVITHDAFQRIGVKPESVDPIRDEILADLEEELEAAAKDAGARVRRGQLEQQIEAVNQRFDSILSAGKKDGVVDFEDMGVDFIFADEAHVYRKLDFHTAQSIKGIDPNGSRRALDMYVKTRHLDRQRPGRAMVFASGTAVTNTMGEIYTIMRFFDPKTLDEGGISTFDSWARMFGEVAAALEPNAAGKYEVVERFAKFDNVPELMARVRKFMDVLQSDQLGAIVKRPETRGGKPNLNLVEPTKAMQEYQATVLQPRLEASRKWKPSKDEPNNPDPVIAIISDGRLAATDPRFIPGGKVRPGETTKIDEAADKIAAEYRATASNVYLDRDGKPMAAKGGTQIVFYNVGFGAASSARRGFDSRGTFTKAIVSGGVKREHIAWFDDADTDAKKEAIFKGMRNGTYRVLIGSAKKMGTGVNVQNRLTALHYMDPPWFPADVEQPRGRIIRQGNQNAIVDEQWYATKGGYDSTMWQMVGRKQRFIDQAFRGDKNLRSMEDLGEASMYEQAAALASGDPRAMQLAGLRQDVERLERQQAAHASEQINARAALRGAEWDIESAEKRVKTYGDAYKAIGGSYFQFSTGTVGRATHTKQTEFGQALKDAFNKVAADAVLEPTLEPTRLGTIGNGLQIDMHPGYTYVQEGKGKDAPMVKVPSGSHGLTVTAAGLTLDVGESMTAMGADVDALGIVRKMVNALNGIESDLRRARAQIESSSIDVTRLRKKIGAPFEHQQDMLEKWAALKALEEELRLEGLAQPTTGPQPMKFGDAYMIQAQGSEKEARYFVMNASGQPHLGQPDLGFRKQEDAQLWADTRPDPTAPPWADQARIEAALTDAWQKTTGAITPLFSRNGGPAGVHMADAKAIVEAIRAANPAAPTIHVHETLAQAPKALRDAINKAGAQGDVEAAFHEGEIHVFPSHMASVERMAFVVGHHEIRHYGLRSILGPRLGPVALSLWTTNPALRAAAQKVIDDGHATSRVLAIEEALADMPVADLEKLTGWGKVVAAIRQWLRGVAQRLREARFPALADAFEPARWTDNDVAALVSRAEGVSKGGPSAYRAGGTAFGRAADRMANRVDQTMTDNFKRWFGGSKVVDDEGAPLRAYHITKGDFSVFLPGGKDPTVSGRAIWFTDNAESQPANHNVSSRGQEFQTGTNVMPVYLRMERPLLIDDKASLEWAREVFANGSREFPQLMADKWVAEVTRDGEYDGIIFDGPALGWKDSVREYIVFDSTQIKSATGNNGAFDPANPDIRYSRAPRVTQESKDGAPVFTSDDITIAFPQDTERFEVIAQPGERVVNYAIMPTTGFDVLGHVELLIRDGKPVSLLDIEINPAGRRQGAGRKTVEALLAANPDADLNISNIVQGARGFWAKMGVPEQNQEQGAAYDGNLNWQTYVQAQDGNRTIAAAGQSRAAREERDTGTEGGSRGAAGEAQGGLTRFSRAPTTTATAPGQLAEALTNLRAAKLPAGYIVNDFITSHGKLSWWHKSVGSMHNLAERNPAFKTVYDAAQDFLNDVSSFATEAADLAPRMLPKLDGLRDIAKAPLSAADTKAISDAIFQGTLNWTRDANGQPVEEEDPAQAGIVWTDGELRDRFNMDAAQIGLYHEFRKATDKSLTDLGISDMLRYAGKDAEPVASAALASGDVHQAARLIQDRLDDLARAAGPERAKILGDTAATVYKKANQIAGLIRRGYAPLTRFGNYTLDVTENGERVYFGLFETEREANAFARRLKGAYPQAAFTQGTLSQQAYKLFAGVSPETVELFGNMLGLESQGTEASDQAFQDYLKLAKGNRSAMKRLIHRKGIAGFSEDAGRVLAGFVYSNARQASKNLHFSKITAATQAIADTKGQGQLLDSAVSLHQYITNPVEEAQKFKGLLFAQFLGGSLAAGLVNLSQTAMVTFPYLTQFGGVAKAAGQMKAALADATKWETGKKTTGDATLDAAIKKAEEDGIISPQEVHNLIAQAGGGGALKAGDGTKAGDLAAKGSNFVSKLMLLWGRPFALAEQFNRRVTFIAAYRTAVEQGMPDPAGFAEKTVVDTQFSYTKANRPQWARGAIGSTLFTFKTFSISYVELLSRMAKDGPEGRKAALVGLGMLFLASGLQGLPGADDLDDLIDGLLQRLGYNFNTKLQKREFFASMFGESGARFLMSGASGLPGMPIDVAGRLGLGNLIPGTGLFTKKADHTMDVVELAGPAGSFAKQVFAAADKISQGEVMGAGQALLPVAAANAAKAMDMASTGMYRDTRGRKVIDTDGIDATMKAIGFQPNDVARVQNATRDVQEMVALNKMREGEIADKWARGIFEQNPKLAEEARAELARWNENNPTSRISIGTAQLLKRIQSMRQDKITRISKTTPAEMRSSVRRELEGAQQ